MTDRIVVECELDAAPAKVWRALTEPDLLARWLAPNDMRPEIGARFSFLDSGTVIDCEVVEVEPPHKISYRWRREGDAAIESVVSFELTEAVAGCTHLRLVHTGFPIELATPLLRMRADGRVVSLALAAACRNIPLSSRRAA